MKRLLLAMVVVAFIAMPAYASVQNVKVSGDIDSTFISRDQFDLGEETDDTSSTTDFYQNIFITQTRVRVDADLTDNVSTTVRLINERAWDAESTSNTQVDLDLAYATFREMLYQPLTVTVGRQLLRYGNAFLIGDPNTNNQATGSGLASIAADLSKQKAFDAVKLVFDYHPLTIDLFAAKIDANTLLGKATSTGLNTGDVDDINLYGINANYQLGDSWNTAAEAYFFARIDNSAQNTVRGTKPDKTYVPGLRASTNPIKGLNVQGEVAWQGGAKQITTSSGGASNDNIPRNAIGAQFIANYAVQHEKVAKWKPVLQGVYTFVSGDKDPNLARGIFKDNSVEEYNAWDPFFEDQAGGKIYNTLFDLSNTHIAQTSLALTPIEDLTSTFTWTGMWLHQSVNCGGGTPTGPGICEGPAARFGMRQPDGTVTTPQVTSNKDVGWEFDTDWTYDYTEDVKLGFSAGWFFPGELFTSLNHDTAKQFLVSADVNF